MNRQTAEALEASIAHWDANAKVGSHKDLWIGKRYCALCGLFNTNREGIEEWNCRGCPVYSKTKKQYCESTPFVLANSRFRRWLGDEDFGELFRAAAIAERDFLIGLREPIDEEATPSTEAP